MIQKYVNRFMESEAKFKQELSELPPGGYLDLVKKVIGTISDVDDYGGPDPNLDETSEEEQ